MAELLAVSTQAVPQSVCVPVQLELHAPLLQTSLAWHALVQLPQWVASEATQDPLQSRSPAPHWHWLLWQV